MSKYKSRGVNLDLTKEEDILIEQHLLKQRNISQYIRIIGYLRPIKLFSIDRQIEAGTRVYNKNINI